MRGRAAGGVRWLDRAVPAPAGKPVRAGAEETQRLAREVAVEPSIWDSTRAGGMAARFDTLSAEWDGERGGYRRQPLADALNRGGPFGDGLAVEVASGTGLLTPLVEEVWPRVVAVDLSAGMLARARAGLRVRADAFRLPVPGGSAAAVVIGDGLLFAGEVARVMSPGAVLVWSNALGEGAPYFVPPAVLVGAMTRATGEEWTAVCAEAHWGSWSVLRRVPGSVARRVPGSVARRVPGSVARRVPGSAAAHEPAGK